MRLGGHEPPHGGAHVIAPETATQSSPKPQIEPGAQGRMQRDPAVFSMHASGMWQVVSPGVHAAAWFATTTSVMLVTQW